MVVRPQKKLCGDTHALPPFLGARLRSVARNVKYLFDMLLEF